MKKEKNMCDPARLSRFLDRELEPDEYAAINSHIQNCPRCQKILQGNQCISSLLRAGLERKSHEVNLQEMEDKVMAKIKNDKGGTPWQSRLEEYFMFKRFYIPAATVIAVLLVVFSFLGRPISTPGPSAIIKSFQGSVGSVMILETPKSRQTILWFNEALVSGSEDEEAPKNKNRLGYIFKARLCVS